MSEEKRTGVHFDADEPNEAALWQALGDIPDESPSPQLRRGFYRKLDGQSAPGLGARLTHWLGFAGSSGWLTAAATLLLGVILGQTMTAGVSESDPSLEVLEQQVAVLNRSLILDRLESDSPSKRLRGVLDAVDVANSDAEVARALLRTATDDRVHAVRTAAIDALGPQLRSTPSIGSELIQQLEAAESPLVQLALVDLVLRYGSSAQIEYLLELAEGGRLHPDLVEHVLSSISRTRA